MCVIRFRAAFRCWQWVLVAASLIPAATLIAEPSPHLIRAKLLLTAGHEDAALIELQALLRTEPKNLFALGNAGLILGRHGQFSRAAEYLSRAHSLKPDDVQLGLALLEVYARSGRKDDADRVATEVRASGQLTGEQALAAAQLLFRTGNLQSAASLAAAGPADSVDRHDLLGSIYAGMGDVRKASDEFQEAIRLAPADDQRYFRLGMLYLKYRTPSLALIVFGNGIERRPDSPILWLGLGVSQCLDEKLQAAETSLRKAIELNAHFSDAYLLLGDTLEQERPQEAIAIFRRAMTEHPDLPVAYYYYGRLALQLNEGSIQETVAILKKAVALEPSFPDSHYELGRALEQAGDVNEAIKQFEDSLRLNPKLFRAQYRLAILYKKRGDAAKANIALKAFQQAQKSQDPDLELKRLEYEIRQP
jgi:tetratricopeptide (TPR) repeat protein